MDKGIKLSILTLDRHFYDGEVKEITTASSNGVINVLRNHMPLITSLKPSITTFMDINGVQHKAFISTGILKIKDNEARIICGAAEWPDEIDIERAKASRARAEERLKNNTDIDVKRAELALHRSLLRLRARGL
jgi:F-type H+-transporting ATPase subunit epsilon